jgi:hypothetical protein
MHVNRALMILCAAALAFGLVACDDGDSDEGAGGAGGDGAAGDQSGHDGDGGHGGADHMHDDHGGSGGDHAGHGGDHAGHGGDHAGHGGMHAAGGEPGGGSDRPGDTFVAGLTKPGADGALMFMLMDARPAPPDLGDNTWMLMIADPEGAALAGCSIDVEPFMPQHGHGTNVAASAAEQDEPAGHYEIAPLDFFMPGLWEVTFEATCGDATDAATFGFWVEG